MRQISSVLDPASVLNPVCLGCLCCCKCCLNPRHILQKPAPEIGAITSTPDSGASFRADARLLMSLTAFRIWHRSHDFWSCFLECVSRALALAWPYTLNCISVALVSTFKVLMLTKFNKDQSVNMNMNVVSVCAFAVLLYYELQSYKLHLVCNMFANNKIGLLPHIPSLCVRLSLTLTSLLLIMCMLLLTGAWNTILQKQMQK